MASIFCACSIAVRHANAPSFGRVERSYRDKMSRPVRIGSFSLRWGCGEAPAQYFSVCPGAHARCAQVGRRTDGRHAYYPCGACREAQPTIDTTMDQINALSVRRVPGGPAAKHRALPPLYITHKGAWSLRMCHCARQGERPFAISLAKIDMLFTGKGAASWRDCVVA